MAKWTFRTQNVLLNIWDNASYDPDEIVLKVASKMVERAIGLDCVARQYILQDAPNLKTKPNPTKILLEETKTHLRKLPTLNFFAGDQQPDEYGYTENIAQPSEIFLNDNMVANAKIVPQAIRKFRLAFLIFVTILHEMSHAKLRQQRKRNSPETWFPAIGSKPEAGQFAEIKLFGGVIGSFNGPSDVSKGLYLQTNSTTKSIPDEFIVKLVKQLVSGKALNRDDFKIKTKPRKQQKKSQKTNTKKKSQKRTILDQKHKGRHIFMMNGIECVS